MKSRLAILTSALVVALSAIVLSQTAGQTPPRDQPRITLTGTAVVTGAVVADDDRRAPLRRVKVLLMRVGVEEARQISSDDQGRYQFELLPTGTYTLSFSKGAYITMDYGALQTGQPGHSIVVAEGQIFRAEPVALLKGAVIAGRVVDPSGSPAGLVNVRASQFFAINGVRQERVGWGTDGNALTNQHGEYRIFGLMPGDYLVYVDRARGVTPEPATAVELGWAAQPNGPAPPRGRSTAFAPTLFPGTSNPSAAQPITLARGDERLSVDLPLQAVPVSQITGNVTGLDGRPAARTTVWRSPKRVVPFTTMDLVQTSTDSSGRFAFENVAPGDYVLTARATAPAVASGPRNTWALADVTVTGQDVAGVGMALQPAMSASGRLVVQAAGNPPWPLNMVRVTFSQVANVPRPASTPQITTNADGTFTTDGLMPGAYRMRVTVPASSNVTWTAKSAMLGDRDLLDTAIDVGPGVSLSDLVVTLTDVRSQLSGTIKTSDGQAAQRLYVTVFSTDAADWWAGSRRIQSVQTLASGAYTIDGLPAGEYYLCALAESNRQLLYEPSYLSQLSASSIKIRIGDGEKKTQDLQVRR